MIRVGTGFDLHRLVAGRPLFLGGVKIEHHLGLEGHSDADVLIHALIDAMLGAAALRDIGCHFPPGDRRYLNISSLKLLEETAAIVKEKGYQLVNADLTVIAEQPKLAPYIEAMREKLAATLGLSPDRVSVKATTSEGVGTCGRQEAICAQAAVLIENISAPGLPGPEAL